MPRNSDIYMLFAIAVVIMTIIAVIVGVVWTASTGQSGQRVYLWSALIGMSVFLLLWYIFFSVAIVKFHLMSIVYLIIIPLVIVLGIGFFITGMIHPGTGHNTDSLPYLISAVISIAVIIFGYACSLYMEAPSS